MAQGEAPTQVGLWQRHQPSGELEHWYVRGAGCAVYNAVEMVFVSTSQMASSGYNGNGAEAEPAASHLELTWIGVAESRLFDVF